MKINETTRIVGEKVVLVPYRKHHVERYNQWMSNPEIQELTSSEPLSLEQEYNMQITWQQDEDKLTFIILRKDLYDEKCAVNENTVDREVNAMIGDVNIFIIDSEVEENTEAKDAELEIMIVDKENRGNGYGSESISLMIYYYLEHVLDRIKIGNFVVKIDETNEPSIKMFEKLGFLKYKYVKPFKQVSLKLDINNVKNTVLKKKTIIDTNY